MKVCELIRRLQKYPGDAEVMFAVSADAHGKTGEYAVALLPCYPDPTPSGQRPPSQADVERCALAEVILLGF